MQGSNLRRGPSVRRCCRGETEDRGRADSLELGRPAEAGSAMSTLGQAGGPGTPRVWPNPAVGACCAVPVSVDDARTCPVHAFLGQPVTLATSVFLYNRYRKRRPRLRRQSNGSVTRSITRNDMDNLSSP